MASSEFRKRQQEGSGAVLAAHNRRRTRSRRMIQVVDAHCAGEPARVVVGGVPDMPGDTVFDKMQHFARHSDGLRKLLLKEPRGMPAQNVDLLVPACHKSADMGYIIMEQIEYPPMSGHNTICTATVLLETGILPMEEPETKITLEAPVGLIPITATCKDGRVTAVTLQNEPCFVTHLDAELDVPTIGKVKVDVAFGGMFYVLCDVEQLGVKIVPEQGAKLAELGEKVKTAAAEQLPVVHPSNPLIEGVSIIVLRGDNVSSPGSHAKNTVVVSTGVLDWDNPATWTGALDRSPCGTGTCATMAVRHARGQLKVNQDFVHEGILGTQFTGRILSEGEKVGEFPSIVPQVTGRAWITAHSTVILEADDPFPEGFTVGDIWA